MLTAAADSRSNAHSSPARILQRDHCGLQAEPSGLHLALVCCCLFPGCLRCFWRRKAGPLGHAREPCCLDVHSRNVDRAPPRLGSTLVSCNMHAITSSFGHSRTGEHPLSDRLISRNMHMRGFPSRPHVHLLRHTSSCRTYHLCFAAGWPTSRWT